MNGKRKIFLILIIIFLSAVISSGIVIYNVFLKGQDGKDNISQRLSTPMLYLDGNKAYWNPDINADKYEIFINNVCAFVDQGVTEIELFEGQSLKVRAVGNEKEYLTSDWSNTVTYISSVISKLNKPIVSINGNGLAVWNTVNGASGYAYKLNSGEEIYTSDNFVSLSLGQSICVKALGDGKTYSDSDYSEVCTYIPSALIKLDVPTVNVSKEGIAYWKPVDFAVGYAYKINYGIEIRITNTEIQLSSGLTVSVKALGDGEIYSDSDYSEEVVYQSTNITPDIPPDSEKTRLSSPIVTVSGGGIASWCEVAGATGYAYKIDEGAEVVTESTSVQLSYLQSISVKALGDGENYLDSEYSKEVVYIPQSPQLLGFLVSDKSPDSDIGLPSFDSPSSSEKKNVTLENYAEVLKNHFKNEDNYLKDEYPKESDYSLYTKPYKSVFLQIWLDNPEQYKILSICINGVKYVRGENLFAHDVENHGKTYSCVFVIATVPAGAYGEFTYSLSDIEYLENIFIEEYKLKGKNTVKIGLPYEKNDFAVSDFKYDNSAVNAINYQLSISGNEDFLSEIGAWLGFMVYDGAEIKYNGALTIGTNVISASGLVEDTEYISVVYLYADLHDGCGVTAHLLYYSAILTPKAISFEELRADVVYNSEENFYYPQITVKTSLKDERTQYLCIELYDKDDNLVYKDMNYNGEAVISEGVLNGAKTTVRVYYRDNEYPSGRSIESAVWVDPLGDISLYGTGYKVIGNDVIYEFKLGNNTDTHPYVKSFKLLLYDKSSVSYIAENVLRIMDNSNAINIAHSKYQKALDDLLYVDIYTEKEEYLRIEKIAKKLKAEWLELLRAKELFESDYSDRTDRAWWEAQLEKGRFCYEIEYNGIDTELVSRVGKAYSVVLSDYYELDSRGNHSIKIIAQVDKNDGKGISEVDLGEVAVAFG